MNNSFEPPHTPHGQTAKAGLGGRNGESRITQRTRDIASLVFMVFISVLFSVVIFAAIKNKDLFFKNSDQKHFVVGEFLSETAKFEKQLENGEVEVEEYEPPMGIWAVLGVDQNLPTRSSTMNTEDYQYIYEQW